MQKVVAVVGPTASGKTGLSIAIAKRFGGEVVSADSMQIYHQMNIGTAKPSMEERDGVPHHLMGHISVEETYNVASYVGDARRLLAELEEENCLPVLCGGTGLYLDHLLGNTDFFDIPVKDEVRKKYQEMARTQGNAAIFSLLQERDPTLAAHLHCNDGKRIIRGLEVLETTGRRLSDFQAESTRQSPYEVLYIGLNYKDRTILYDRINRRVDQMMEQGLLQEVLQLIENYRLSDTARAAIGYKELLDALESGGDLTAAVELIKQKSRNYAKRQLTWFRKNEDIHWFYPDEQDGNALKNDVFNIIETFLKGGAL